MTRRTALLIGLTGGFARAYAPKEFWNEKRPLDWTSEEIEQLLNKSPWAKEASVSYYGGQNGPLSNTMPGARSRSSRNASSGTSPSAVSPAAWKAIVRWESALPVREALKAKPSPDVEKFYILNMVGDVPSVGATPDEDESQRLARFETLKQVTKLEHRGDAILLSRVAVAPKSALSLAGTLFYFSRDLALRPKDNQAVFSTKLGPIDVKCKFALKDMMYQGNLEL
ncbi:MAG TPA: hypothetical protein VNU44_13535 [Bryobacteraceae bacterium]|jgi:hypothetical protein|nr:hypothetical protein [Bryobacteraceae bacterium]